MFRSSIWRSVVRPVFGLAIGAAVAFGFAAPAEAQKRANTIRFAYDQVPENVDPYFNNVRIGVIIAHQVWDTLIYRDPKTNEYKGQLATAWRWLDPTTLAVLARDSFGRVVVLRVTRGSVHTELELPPPPRPELAPGTLGLALVDEGRLGVLMSPSSGPPTQEDPALLFVAGKSPTKLAAWHTLEPASSPACADRKGAALALAAPSAWLSTGLGVDPGQATWLAVRWSSERVCLEAVDAPGLRLDTPLRELDARTIARFDAKPSAGLLAIGEGVELRDRRSCELVPPRSSRASAAPAATLSTAPAR